MGMRTDCRHYSRRTGAQGETTEQCDVGAAPDAPLRCPDACPSFEARKLSTIGFDYGSLDAARSSAGAGPADAAGSQGGDDVDALFAQLRDVVDDVADSAVADEAERRRAETVREQRRRRRRIR
ncbi:MAG: hypothetical protein U0U69_03380 [Acidimicrobiia bacterium]